MTPNTPGADEPRSRTSAAADVADLSPPPAYRAAIRSYVDAEVRELAARGLTQKPAARAIVKLHPGSAPAGLIVLLHGFSAGPKQWESMVDELYARGYDVFVPALPGHGLIDAKGAQNTELVPDDPRDWDAFLQHLKDVAHGAKVSLAGCSVGAVLALRWAEGEPNVKGPLVAVVPFLEPAGDFATLGPAHVSNALVVKTLRGLKALFGLGVDRLLAKKQFDIQGPTPAIDYGFRYANEDQILALTELAKLVRDDAGKLAGKNVQVLATEIDRRTRPEAARELAAAAGADIFVFPADRQVPHAMISPLENPDASSVSEVRSRVLGRLPGAV